MNDIDWRGVAVDLTTALEGKNAEIARLRSALADSLQNGPEAPIDVDRWVNARDEIARLRLEKAALVEAVKAVVDGNYPGPRSHRPGKCQHGVFYYNACENCIDEFLLAALRSATETKDGQS